MTERQPHEPHSPEMLRSPEQLDPMLASPEQEPFPAGPAGYFASLSDYNAGRLHGVWVQDLTDAEDVQEQISEMLAQSSEPLAEEWALHDYEGLGEWRPSEYESLDTLALMARGIVEHGAAFAAWADYLGDLDDERIEAFDYHFCGQWRSMEEYAADLLADHGFALEEHVPQWIRPYVNVDFDSLGRDLAMELHVTDDGDGGIWVFNPET